MGVGMSIAEELGKRQAAEEEPLKEPEQAAAPDQPEQAKSAKNGERCPHPAPQPSSADAISHLYHQCMLLRHLCVSTIPAEQMHVPETIGSVQGIYADQICVNT